MKKEVVISIKGIQTVDDESDEIELVTKGNYYEKAGAYYIIYDESEATGFDATRTTMKIEKDKRVTLHRRGDYRSQLIIEKGIRHMCHYGTQYGDFMIGVYSNQIDFNLAENGGNLYFKYSLDINSSLASENEVYINIKECKNSGNESNSGSASANTENH